MADNLEKNVGKSISINTEDNALNSSKIIKTTSLVVAEDDEEFPEGGWGWVIVLCSLLLFAIVDGTQYSFGTLYIALIERFEGSSAATTWILSVQLCMYFISGPLGSAMVTLIGARVTIIIGSVTVVVGTIASGFATNLTTLYFTIGIINGTGLGIINQPCQTINSFYFKKRRGIANAIASCGTGLGLFVMPPLTNYLLDEYGFQGALLLLAGVPMQAIVCAALIIPPAEVLAMIRRSNTEKIINDVAIAEDAHISSNKEKSFHKQGAEKHAGADLKTVNVAKNLKIFLKASFDFNLYKNYYYTFFSLSAFFMAMFYQTPYLFVSDRAVSYAISKEESSFLVSANGIAGIIGKLIVGSVADVKRMRPYRPHMYMCLIMATGLLSLVSFGQTLVHQLIYSSLSGACLGAVFCLYCSVLVDIVGIRNLTTALGMMFFFNAFAVLAGPSVFGWIFDVTQSYPVVFAYGGSGLFLSGAILLLIPTIERLKRNRKGRKDACGSNNDAFQVYKISDTIEDI